MAESAHPADPPAEGGAAPPAGIVIRRIGGADIRAALAAGWADFMARPTAVVFLFIVYPALGVVMSYAAFNYELLPLVVPLMGGFALVAPVTAVGLYEISRRREAGDTPPTTAMLEVRRRPGFPAILTVAGLLLVLFAGWMAAAQQIVIATLGSAVHPTIGTFLGAVFGTAGGMAMFVIGNAVGFCFAVAAAAVSVFSLPLLVDGETSAGRAIGISLRACAANPVTMASWGVTVAVILFASMVPFLAGLVIALPVLGHATWHLYRRTLARAA